MTLATIGHMWLDGWGMLVWLASAAFWILLIVGIVALIRGHLGGAGGAAGSTSALRILEERYARGELSRVEFLKRRATLGEKPPAAPPPEEAPTQPQQPET